MASPNAALLDPLNRSRVSVLLGGGDPMTAGSVAGEAFLSQLGLGPLGLDAPESASDRRRRAAGEIVFGAERQGQELLAQRNQQGTVFSGRTQQDMSDIQRAAQQALQNLRPLQREGGGGGRGQREPRAPAPRPQARAKGPNLPAPEAPPPPPSRNMIALQRALRAADITRRAVSQRRDALRRTPPGTPLGGFGAIDPFRGLPLPGGFSSPEQAFAQTLAKEMGIFKEPTPQDKMARQALQKMGAGDTMGAEEMFTTIAKRNIRNLGFGGGGRTTMLRNLRGAAMTVTRAMGEDPSFESALMARMSPQMLEKARDLAARGASEDVLAQFIEDNTEVGQRFSAKKRMRSALDAMRELQDREEEVPPELFAAAVEEARQQQGVR